jgi:hypothetical protein
MALIANDNLMRVVSEIFFLGRSDSSPRIAQ